VSRFGTRVELQLPDATRLAKMLAKKTALPMQACEMLAKFEKDVEKGGVRTSNCESTAGLRSLIAWAELVLQGVPSRDAFGFAVLNSANADDAAYWQQEATSTFDHGAFEILASGNPTIATAQEPTPDAETRTRAGFGEL